jgi:hypothetical protein
MPTTDASRLYPDTSNPCSSTSVRIKFNSFSTKNNSESTHRQRNDTSEDGKCHTFFLLFRSGWECLCLQLPLGSHIRGQTAEASYSLGRKVKSIVFLLILRCVTNATASTTDLDFTPIVQTKHSSRPPYLTERADGRVLATGDEDGGIIAWSRNALGHL